MPKFSIIIPVYNHLTDCLKPLLDSLFQFTKMEEVEVIIVANGCNDGTEDYVWGLDKPQVRVIRFDQPLGYPKAVNVGIQNARGEYIVLLNSDCILQQQNPSDWLYLLSTPLDENKKIAITGVTEIYDKHSGYDFIIFFCAMIPKRIFNELGLLEEGFGKGGGEDIEYAIRVQHAGYKIQQVPMKTSELWSYHTWFPIFHAAESTVRHLPDWEESFQSNMATLSKKFRQSVRRSIVIAATENAEDLQKCINSIWKYTSYVDTEIIVVFDQTNQGVSEYLNQVGQFGPYRRLATNGQMSMTDAFSVGIKATNGIFIYGLSGRAALLPQHKNDWLNIFDSALVGCDFTAPVYVDGYVHLFCFAAHKRIVENIQFSDEIAINLSRDGKKCTQTYNIPIFFPG